MSIEQIGRQTNQQDNEDLIVTKKGEIVHITRFPVSAFEATKVFRDGFFNVIEEELEELTHEQQLALREERGDKALRDWAYPTNKEV